MTLDDTDACICTGNVSIVLACMVLNIFPVFNLILMELVLLIQFNCIVLYFCLRNEITNDQGEIQVAACAT